MEMNASPLICNFSATQLTGAHLLQENAWEANFIYQ